MKVRQPAQQQFFVKPALLAHPPTLLHLHGKTSMGPRVGDVAATLEGAYAAFILFSLGALAAAQGVLTQRVPRNDTKNSTRSTARRSLSLHYFL